MVQMQRQLKWFPFDKNNTLVRLKSAPAIIFINKEGVEMVILEAEVFDTLEAAHLKDIYHRLLV